jgi:hypothetical protein
MKRTLRTFSLVFLFGCNGNAPAPKADYLLNENGIKDMVEGNHKKLEGRSGDYFAFKNYLKGLSNQEVSSIPFALDYINTCIKTDEMYQDSIFHAFVLKFNVVANKLEEKFVFKYKAIIEDSKKDFSSDEARNFESNLSSCGFMIDFYEERYHPSVRRGFIYNNFINRVSSPVGEYMGMENAEEEEGFMKDGVLMITFEQVYQRIKKREKFLRENPNTVCNDVAHYSYVFLVETLITGTEKSRVFNLESSVLLPQVKSLYERIIKEDSGTPTGKFINSYYALLSRHQFKDDSIAEFLKATNIEALLAAK